MKKLRVLVLMHQDLIPPDSLKGYSDKEIVEWKTEYDVVTTLKEMGHEVLPLGVTDHLGVVRNALDEWQPQIAFNLLEEFHGSSLFDHHVASYMELKKQHYTGCNPRGLLITHDKALSKKILSYHRIKTPKFVMYPRGRAIKIPKRLKFPLFVKSLFEDGSYGIAQASIVHNAEKLNERVQYLHNELETPVIAEEYIEGRELYIPMLGNKRIQSLPVVELLFGDLSEDIPRIATNKIKWDWKYQEQHNIDIRPADLSPQLTEKIKKLGKRVYRALELSGYARLDLRMTDEGEVYVLEANANPDIGYGEELSIAAEAAGIKYEQLLQKVINLGLNYSIDCIY